MSVLSSSTFRRPSLGLPTLETVFRGFEPGDFIVFHGDAASFMCFALSVRAQLSFEQGGLDSSTVFVDGGNTFNPYSVAEIARGYGLDSRMVLEKIHVSRAFTAYQLSSLILGELDSAMKKSKTKLLIVSDATSLFLDRDVPKVEAEDLFVKVCVKLSEIAGKKQTIVATSYFPEKHSIRGLLFEAVLSEKCNVLIRARKTGKVLSFALEDYARLKASSRAFTVDDNSNRSYRGVNFGKDRSIL
jgi:hypothetical protein